MIITVNVIRDAIVGALASGFPGVKIFDEEIKQGLKVPSLFVKTLLVGQDKELNRRYKRDHSFDIHYFGVNNEDCHRAAEILYEALGYIVLPAGLMRGLKLHHEVVDGVLHFFADYDVRLIKSAPPQVKMQDLKQEEVAIRDGQG